MADTVTPNYNLTKPEVGSSANTWGGKTNGNWDTLDQKVKEVSDKANAAFPNVQNSVTNLNDVITPGVYALSGVVSNGPFSQMWGPLVVFRMGDVVFQIIGHNADNPQLCFRTAGRIEMPGQSPLWGAWRVIGRITNGTGGPSGGVDGDIHLQW